MTPRKAIRSRKARMRTTCPACRGPILPAQLITSENRQPFVHTQCFLAARPGTAQVAPAPLHRRPTCGEVS
jgi:hypothetical protein